jgi:hypothetical protein
MVLERNTLMKRLSLSQEEIEKTADRIVDEFQGGRLQKTQFPEEREEKITEKILDNQSILIYGPQTAGRTIFGRQLILTSVIAEKRCVFVTRNIHKITKTRMLLKRDISGYENLILIEVPERGKLLYLPLDILHAGMTMKKIDLVLFDSITHLSLTDSFYAFFDRYLKKAATMDIQTVLSLTEAYDTRPMITKLSYLFDAVIRVGANNVVEVAADNLASTLYSFSVVKQEVVFGPAPEEETRKSPRDVVKGG